jgi:hypothetical protein
LLAGTYTVTVEVPGFKRAIHNHVVLGIGQRVRSDFTLEVGLFKQQVEWKVAENPLQTKDRIV